LLHKQTITKLRVASTTAAAAAAAMENKKQASEI
jgi:hypothetical protein